MQKAYDKKGNEVHPDNGLDFSPWTACADALVFGMEQRVNGFLASLIRRSIRAKKLRDDNETYEQKCLDMGYNPIEEPLCLSKWKFIFDEVVFGHGRKWNKEIACWETVSVESILRERIKDHDEAERLITHYESEVESYMGIPTAYSWDDDPRSDVPGFYEVMNELADNGIRFWGQWNFDLAVENVSQLKAMKAECNA
tara:strand:- start:1284 stop:1877 length:594 start_codon:yes stop_codon:yes gene_type:complete